MLALTVPNLCIAPQRLCIHVSLLSEDAIRHDVNDLRGELAARGVPRKDYDESAPWAGQSGGGKGGGGGRRLTLDGDELAALRASARRQSAGGGVSRGSQDSGRGVRIQARDADPQARPQRVCGPKSLAVCPVAGPLLKSVAAEISSICSCFTRIKSHEDGYIPIVQRYWKLQELVCLPKDFGAHVTKGIISLGRSADFQPVAQMLGVME